MWTVEWWCEIKVEKVWVLHEYILNTLILLTKMKIIVKRVSFKGCQHLEIFMGCTTYWSVPVAPLIVWVPKPQMPFCVGYFITSNVGNVYFYDDTIILHYRSYFFGILLNFSFISFSFISFPLSDDVSNGVCLDWLKHPFTDWTGIILIFLSVKRCHFSKASCLPCLPMFHFYVKFYGYLPMLSSTWMYVIHGRIFVKKWLKCPLNAEMYITLLPQHQHITWTIYKYWGKCWQ